MCTDFILPNDGELVISGRTLDWETPFDASLYMVPAGTEFASVATPGKPVAKWTSRFHYVGIQFRLLALLEAAIRGFDELLHDDSREHMSLVDGMNEAGLSAAILWMPGTTFPPLSDSIPNLCSFDVVTWIVGQYDSTQQLYDDLQAGRSVNIWSGWPKKDTAMHYAVHDRRGDTLIIEAVGGELQLYQASSDRPRPPFPAEPTASRVLTNYPPLPWQLKNMYGYINLTSENVRRQVVGQDVNGSGMLGLPGDATPPSRFVRTTVLADAVPKQTEPQAGVEQALQVLDSANVIRGEVRPSGKPEQLGDYTQWSVVRDHTNLAYYFRTAENMNLRGVVLGELDWREQTHIDLAATNSNWFDNVSSSLAVPASLT